MHINNKHTDYDGGGGARRGLTVLIQEHRYIMGKTENLMH